MVDLTLMAVGQDYQHHVGEARWETRIPANSSKRLTAHTEFAK